MAFNLDQTSSRCNIDAPPSYETSTPLPANMVCDGATSDGDAATEFQEATDLPHPTLVTSDPPSELRTPPLLSATNCRPLVAKSSEHSPSSLKPSPLMQEQRQQNALHLSPLMQMQLVQPCSFDSSGSGTATAAVSVAEASTSVFTLDRMPVQQRTSTLGDALPLAFSACGKSTCAPSASTTKRTAAESGASVVTERSSSSHAPKFRPTQDVTSIPANFPQASPLTSRGDMTAKSNSCAWTQAAIHDSADALTESCHPDRPLSLAAGVRSRGSSDPSTTEASSTSAFGAALHSSVPTLVSRVSCTTHAGRPSGCDVAHHPQYHRPATSTRSSSNANVGSESPPLYAAVPPATASRPPANQPMTLASEHLLCSLPSQRGLDHSSSFFQSGLFLSLEDDFDAQPAAMDAPMTPQSFSNLVQSRGDSAHQSLMSSRHLVSTGGCSPNSTTNAAFANVSVGSVLRDFPQRMVGAAVLSERDSWAASEMVDLRHLEDNTEGVMNGLQPWEGHNESCGGSRDTNGNGSTPTTGLPSVRFGGNGGPITPFDSFRLMVSHAPLCASAVDPADIPATPTDLSTLPCALHERGERHRGRAHGGVDGDTSGDRVAEEEEGGEKDDAGRVVLETNTLVRAHAVAADGHSFYEVINEKYVLYDYELGKGSYSRVHLCYNLNDKHFYAAKVLDKVRLKRRQLGNDYELFKIDQEITIMKQLQHKNIICLREVIRDPNARYVYLIMELAEGREVLKMKNNGDIEPMADGRTDYPESVVRHLARGALQALMYAHYLGIAHRDVKPSNVLTTSHNTVKLCDFGVSVVVGESTMQLRREGSVAFLAPELLLSNEIDVSRSASPALSSLMVSHDKAESGDSGKTASWSAGISSAAPETIKSHAAEMIEEATIQQDTTDEWDFGSPTEQLQQQLFQLSSAATAVAAFAATSSARQHQQQQQCNQTLVTPTTARQTTATGFSGRNNSTSRASFIAGGVGGACGSGFPPLAAPSSVSPQRSLLASKPSLRTPSLPSRTNATTASGWAGVISQYISWLSSTASHPTVDLFKGDVFSLGVTVFTLLLGRLPWRASCAASHLIAVLEEPDPFLRLYKEAYGDGYTWPPAVQKACAPILAFSRHTKNSSRQGGGESVRGVTPTSHVGSYGAVERESNRRVMTPFDTRTVTTEDDDDNDDALEATHNVKGNQNEMLQLLSNISFGIRSVTSPPVPPSKDTTTAAMPALHRAHSLDAATMAVLKNTTPHSSNLRSSKAGFTPDADLITTTTLSATTGLLAQGAVSYKSGTEGSWSTPRVVSASGHAVAAAGSESATLPHFDSHSTVGGIATSQHENSDHGTPSSLWRSVTTGVGGSSGAVATMPDSSMSNELQSALGLCAGGSGPGLRTSWNSSRTDQHRSETTSERRPSQRKQQETAAATSGAAESKTLNSPHGEASRHPLLHWPLVAAGELRSNLECANAFSIANSHGECVRTVTYHLGDSSCANSVQQQQQQQQQLQLLHLSVDSSGLISTLRVASGMNDTEAGNGQGPVKEDKEELRKTREGSLPPVLPPQATSAVVATAPAAADGKREQVTVEGTTMWFSLCDKSADGEAHGTVQQRHDKENVLTPSCDKYVGRRNGDNGGGANTLDANETRKPVVRVRASHDKNEEEAIDRTVSGRDDDNHHHSCDGGNHGDRYHDEVEVDESEGEERIYRYVNSDRDTDEEEADNDDYDDGSDENNIYEQFYEEEGHPCRPYLMAETRPLPALGVKGEGGTRAISAAAVDFVRACLQLHPAQRRTVFELFHHPWISGAAVATTATDNGDEPSLHHHSRGASSFREGGDADDGEEDGGVEDYGAHHPNTEFEHQVVVQKAFEAEEKDRLACEGRAEGADNDSFSRDSPSSWDVPPALYDGSGSYSSGDAAEDMERLTVSNAVRDMSPIDVGTPMITEDNVETVEVDAEEATAAAAAATSGKKGGDESSASADSTTVPLSAVSKPAMMAGTMSSLAATATTVAATNESELATAANTNTNNTAAALGPSLTPPSSPFAPPTAALSPRAFVVPLCHSTKDLLEALTVERRADMLDVQPQTSPLATYGFRPSDFGAPHHARQTSSASSRHPQLSSSYVGDSNYTTSPTGDTSVTATPMAGGTHHHFDHHRLPSRDSRFFTDGASLHSPVFDDTADRLLMSVVTPSSHSTTLNSNSAALGGVGVSSRLAMTDSRRPSSAAPASCGSTTATLFLTAGQSVKVAAMPSCCTISSGSVTTQSGMSAPHRSARATTTSHVDSFLWRNSSERHELTTGHGLGRLMDNDDEEEVDGDDVGAVDVVAEVDGEELSTMTGSLPELLAALPRNNVTTAVDEARSSSPEGELPVWNPATLPPIKPHQESALSSPMCRFLEKVLLRDRE